MQTSSKALVPVVLAIGVIAIGFAAIFFRMAFPTDPWVAAGWRLLIAAAILSPVTGRAIASQTLKREVALVAVGCGLIYAVHFGSWVTSLQYTSVAASVTLVTSTPLLLALWSLFSGKDRPSLGLIGPILLSFTGVMVISGADFRVSGVALWGDALALVGAVAMAAYMLWIRTLKTFPVFAFSGIATGVGGVALLLGAWLRGVPLGPSPEAWLFIGLAAAIPQLIGHTSITWSLRHTTPTVVGLATLIEPVVSALLAWLVFDETLPWYTASGCALTLLGVAAAIWVQSAKAVRPAISPSLE